MAQRTRENHDEEAFYMRIPKGKQGDFYVYPVWLIDDLMRYLTKGEFLVVETVKRETYFKNLEKSRISYDQFRRGTKKEGEFFGYDCYISTNCVKRALKVLMECNVILRTGEPLLNGSKNEGAEYMIQPDPSKVNFKWLDERYKKKKEYQRANAAKSAASRKRNQEMKNGQQNS